MENYPIFVDLKGQPCLVVGGGGVALRKIRLQHSAGAKVTVVAPELCKELKVEFGDQINHIAREFVPSDISSYRLITAATNDPVVNKLVSELAQAVNIPVNVVDQPELCSFITPAIIDREPITIAISTGGAAPVLARSLRAQIEAMVSPALGKLASFMRGRRAQVEETLPEDRARRRFWDEVVNGATRNHFENGKAQLGEEVFERTLQRNTAQPNLGQVSLVGAGPGDPDLLTFKALRLMQQADVVLYDRLVSDAVLNLTRRDADRIYVGKRRANHAVPQPEINQRLFDLAKEGKHVVRLKGGDPFIFGRGAEELELISSAGIPFQIVPGVTAASGCATYAGIPLTHREFAQSCTFVTGHLKDGSVDLDWQTLAAPNQTVVIYMGLLGLPVICDQLIKHGMASSTSIALVERGTTEEQRVFTGTLECLPNTIAKHEVHAPTLIIVGKVVSLNSELQWFDGSSEEVC